MSQHGESNTVWCCGLEYRKDSKTGIRCSECGSLVAGEASPENTDSPDPTKADLAAATATETRTPTLEDIETACAEVSEHYDPTTETPNARTQDDESASAAVSQRLLVDSQGDVRWIDCRPIHRSYVDAVTASRLWRVYEATVAAWIPTNCESQKEWRVHRHGYTAVYDALALAIYQELGAPTLAECERNRSRLTELWNELAARSRDRGRTTEQETRQRGRLDDYIARCRVLAKVAASVATDESEATEG